MSKIGKNLLAYQRGTIVELTKKFAALFALPHDRKLEDDQKSWWWQGKKLQELARAGKSDANFFLTPLETCLLGLLAGEELKEIDEAQGRIALVAEALGVTAGAPETYPLEIVVAILQEKQKDYQMGRFLRSVVELAKDKEAKQLGAAIADYLVATPPFYKGEQAWSKVILFVTLAHAAYARFEILEEKTQASLLSHCYFYALALDAPVRAALERALYDTRTTFTYINMSKLFADALIANTEEIILAKNKISTFGALAKEYLRTAGDNWPTDAEQKKYVTSLSNDLPASIGVWIDQSFTIFRHLQHADLIDNNRGGELTQADQYQNDMLLLLSWFGIGADGQESLVKYFKNNPLVPVRVFLARLKETASLSDPVTVDNVVELVQLLHKEKFLAPNQELIEFHETDGQFHWNEKLIV